MNEKVHSFSTDDTLICAAILLKMNLHRSCFCVCFLSVFDLFMLSFILLELQYMFPSIMCKGDVCFMLPLCLSQFMFRSRFSISIHDNCILPLSGEFAPLPCFGKDSCRLAQQL